MQLSATRSLRDRLWILDTLSLHIYNIIIIMSIAMTIKLLIVGAYVPAITRYT